MAKKRKKKGSSGSRRNPLKFSLTKKQQILLGSTLMLLSIATGIAFISFFTNWQNDQSILTEFADRNAQAENWMNKFGAAVSHIFIYRGFGLSSFIIVFLLFVSGLYLFFNMDKKALIGHWFWGMLSLLWFSVFFGFFSEKAPLLGGIVGFELNDFLKDYIGTIGILLVLLFGFVFYLVIKLQFTPERLLSYLSRTRKEISEEFNDIYTATAQEKATEFSFETDQDILETSKMSDAAIEGLFQEKDENPELPELKVEVAKVEVEKEMANTTSEKLVEDFGEFDPKLELSNYSFPTLELLSDHGAKGGITIDQEELEEHKNRIVETLKHYKIGIAHIKATIGPTVTLYEIIPEAGIRISKIKNLEDDIALSLAALGIRIIAPIPGKGTIGIEVPNKKSTIVSMRSVIASPKFQHAE
ncbi:MAG: DNA translocase FtsK 4TM domain-containing protein, partial [Bacteroidota bacterium]